MVDYQITRRERAKNGYFTVKWSPIVLADKYLVATSVPAVGGIAEIYYMDDRKKLNLLSIVRSWYGGLRSVIRERTDPIEEKDERRRSILLEHEDKIFFRYSCTESHADMDDVLFFFNMKYGADPSVCTHSGRYAKIFLSEVDYDKIMDVQE